MEFPPLVAAVSWIQIAIFILFFLIPLLTQFKGGAEEAKKQRRAQPKRPPRPPAPGGADKAPRPAGGRAALEAEIEEFLGRAGNARAQKKPTEAVAPRADETAPVRRLVPARDQAQSLREAVHDQVIVAQAAEPDELGDGVSRHVQQHMESHPVTEHSTQLGHSIGMADERLESHLHQTFDHQVGRMKQTVAMSEQVQPAAEGTDAAVWETTATRRDREQRDFDDRSASIAAMLRSPTTIQQAVILSEILRRPTDAE